jgi:hypothetical protein
LPVVVLRQADRGGEAGGGAGDADVVAGDRDVGGGAELVVAADEDVLCAEGAGGQVAGRLTQLDRHFSSPFTSRRCR